MASASVASGQGNRLGALRRFALAITILNILGHTILGFEQPWLQPLVALAATYTTELVLETIEALAMRRAPAFRGGARALIDFLLPAHISGLAIAMLLYPADRLSPVVFAAVAAIGSKAVVRVRMGGQRRHVLNPSNFGITAALLLMPTVSISPPYHFTEQLDGAGDWILPLIIVCTGTFLNGRFTRRLPLIAGWLLGFVSQAVVRGVALDSSILGSLVPMSGTAFVLYTFYMVTDPATTPSEPWSQFRFGAAVALTYGLLVAVHVAFGLFFSLTIVCALRGVLLAVVAARARVPQAIQRAPVPATAMLPRLQPWASPTPRREPAFRREPVGG